MAHGSNAILCAFFQGMMMVGVMIGVVATMSYGLDAFRSQSNEIFVMNMVFKVSTRLHITTSRPEFLTIRTTELYVLRPLQLRQQLGCRQGPGRDHVYLRRHYLGHVHFRHPCVHLWQEDAQLVDSPRPVHQVQHADHGTGDTFGLK